MTEGWGLGWAIDFAGRYRHALKQVASVKDVVPLFGPFVFDDAMHSALFGSENVTHLRLPHLGRDVHQALARMEPLTPLLVGLYRSDLDRRGMCKLLARRHHHSFYHKQMLGLLTQ